MNEKILKLSKNLESFYIEKGMELLFHGWHHIVFVRKKSIIFARELGANEFLVEAAALTHDLNYAVKKNSTPKFGTKIRNDFLEKSGFNSLEINKINKIIIEADISTRDENISIEAKALSDADTLFKVIPITPLIFSSKYISENNVSLLDFTNRILKELKPLMNRGILFYSKSAKKKYLEWAKIDLKLIENLKESLMDEEILEVLEIAKSLNILS